MRNVALMLLKKGDKYLVEKFYDEVDKVYFYKLIGGGIEENEKPQEALKREIKEELNSDINILSEFVVIEEKLRYKGIERHIKAYIFEAEFKDLKDYNFLQKFIYSPEGKFLSIAMWKSLEEIQEEKIELYPKKLLELLNK